MVSIGQNEAITTKGPSSLVARSAPRCNGIRRRGEYRMRWAPFGRHSMRQNNNDDVLWWKQPMAKQPSKSSESCSSAIRVLLVHGLERVTCDQVFNMFCLYGNVSQVRVLKDGSVLVELEDVEAAKRCVFNLNSLPLNETTEMRVKYYKHSPFIDDNEHFDRLSDDTVALKNYRMSTFNRYPKQKTRYVDENGIAAPSRMLYFHNAPSNVGGTDIHRTVTEALGRADAVQSITILPSAQPQFSTGLIEFKTIGLAAKAVLFLNHTVYDTSELRDPLLMKLCFSKWSEIRQKSPGSSGLLLNTASRSPRLQHGCEQVVLTKELSRTTSVNVTGGDSSWTLWEMTDLGTGSCITEPMIESDESRSRLCTKNIEQGDGFLDQNEDEEAVGPVLVALSGPLDMFVEIILRDDDFYEVKMELQLVEFYNNHLLKEIVDPKILKLLS